MLTAPWQAVKASVAQNNEGVSAKGKMAFTNIIGVTFHQKQWLKVSE